MTLREFRTYQCSACGMEFRQEWTDDEASREFEARHGRRPDPLTDEIVCDDCYAMILRWEKAQKMTRRQLLEWLAEDDRPSLYGECKGPLLDECTERGFVEIMPAPPGKDDDYQRVRLTPAGFAELGVRP